MNILLPELVLALRELLILIRNCDGRRIIFRYSTIPIIDRLQEILKVPVSIDNDVNCAFGEKWNGSVREKENFIMLTIGTGVGEQFL